MFQPAHKLSPSLTLIPPLPTSHLNSLSSSLLLSPPRSFSPSVSQSLLIQMTETPSQLPHEMEQDPSGSFTLCPAAQIQDKFHRSLQPLHCFYSDAVACLSEQPWLTQRSEQYHHMIAIFWRGYIIIRFSEQGLVNWCTADSTKLFQQTKPSTWKKYCSRDDKHVGEKKLAAVEGLLFSKITQLL